MSIYDCMYENSGYSFYKNGKRVPGSMPSVVEELQDLESQLADIKEENERLNKIIIDAEKQAPVAWAHDAEGRQDVISSAVKDLLIKSFKEYGFDSSIQRPAVCKAEHYTIPLYAMPLRERIATALKEPTNESGGYES